VESGGWTDDPQKQYLRQVNFVGLMAALEAIAGGGYRGVGTELYQELPSNGRRLGDLLITGGRVVIPGLPSYQADLLVNYGKPLLEEEGTIVEIGDLAEMEARDTLAVEGLFIHPADTALDRSHGGVQIAPGARAYFTVTRREDGSETVWSFLGGPPAALTERRR